MSESDQELAKSAAAGDRSAFQHLIERHYDLMYRLAFRYFKNQQDAEDMAQEIAISLPKKLRSFEGNAAFSTWLYRVVINACKDATRKTANRNKLHETYGEVTMLLNDEAKALEAQLDWVYTALEQLDVDLHTTALLVLAENLSHKEVADIMGVKTSTISWRMSEVRKALKGMKYDG